MTVLRELIRVLKRPKFGFPPKIIQSITNELLLTTELIVPSQKISVIESDPTDTDRDRYRLVDGSTVSGADPLEWRIYLYPSHMDGLK